MKTWECLVCGFVYDEAEGWPDEGIAPVLGITEGEVQAGPRKASERWAVHVLQAVVTVLVAERLERQAD